MQIPKAKDGESRLVDLGDGDSVPSDFFFEYYSSSAQSSIPDFVTPLKSAKNFIISKASNFLSGYLEFVSSDFTNHLHNIYNHFRLDEELFLFSLIVLYRYVKITRKALQLKRDSELFYLLILCIIISFKCILDVPIDNGRIAKSLNLDASRLRSNEGQILTALNFNVFFGNKDISELDAVFPVEALSLLSYSAEMDSERVKKEREKILNAWKLKRLQKFPNLPEPNVVHALVSVISPEVDKQKTSPPTANPISPSKVIPNSLSPEAFTNTDTITASAINAPVVLSKSGLSLNAKPFVPRNSGRSSKSKNMPAPPPSSQNEKTINDASDLHHLHPHTHAHQKLSESLARPIPPSLPLSSLPPHSLLAVPPPPPPVPVSVLVAGPPPPVKLLPPPFDVGSSFNSSGGCMGGSAVKNVSCSGGYNGDGDGDSDSVGMGISIGSSSSGNGSKAGYGGNGACWSQNGPGSYRDCGGYGYGCGWEGRTTGVSVSVSDPLPLPLPSLQSGMGVGGYVGASVNMTGVM